MLRTIGQASERGIARIRAAWFGRELARIGAISPLLASAIGDGASSRRSSAERFWFGKIERLRREMLASNEELQLLDYGAGPRKSATTPASSHAGRHLARTLRDVCGASKSPFWAGVLFRLVRWFRPSSGLELGTCLGVSAGYQAAAMALNGVGHLTTCEGAPVLATRARDNLMSLGLGRVVDVVEGRFGQILPDVLPRIGPLEYAFVDGHHEEAATREYFETIKPFLAAKSLVVFDDITWSEGMTRAWNAIASDPRVCISADLGKIGIVLIEPGGHADHGLGYRVPLG